MAVGPCSAICPQRAASDHVGFSQKEAVSGLDVSIGQHAVYTEVHTVRKAKRICLRDQTGPFPAPGQ